MPAGTGRWRRLPNNGGDKRSHSLSHHRSITADLEASLGGSRRKTALRVASCRLDTEKLAAAKAEFAALEQDGIIRRSSSPWTSPLHMVKKPDGLWQCCGDYCRLNNVTVPDTYPLPNMMDFSSRVAGCSIFTKIDLRKGYYQIPMHPADI